MSRRFYAILSVLLMVAGSTMIVTSQVDAQDSTTQETATGDETYSEVAIANGAASTDSAGVEASDVMVTVTKETLGATPDDSTEFAFTVDGEAIATLSNGQSFTVPYHRNMVIAETMPDGWSVSRLFCEQVDHRGDFLTQSIVLFEVSDDVETIDCTFTNRREVTLNITKIAPDDPEAEFTIDGPAGPFVIRHGETVSFPVGAERFSIITERATPGWQGEFDCPPLVNLDDTPGTLQIFVPRVLEGPIDCTLTNTQTDVARVIIKKEVPPGAPTDQRFEFRAGSFNGDIFSLAPGEEIELVRGASELLRITESPAAGWLVPSVGNGITCSGATPFAGGPGVVSVSLTVGSTVTCTFTNTPAIPLTIIKQILDGGDVITTPLEFFFEVTGPGQSNPTLGDAELNVEGAGSTVGVTNADPAGGVVTLAPGQPATVFEEPVTGFELSDASCTGSTGELATSMLAGDEGFGFDDLIPAGETAVTCVVTNVPVDTGTELHSVTVTKQVEGVDAPAQSFSFEASGDRFVELVDGDSFAIQTTGSVWVSEDLQELPSAWSAAIECTTNTGEEFEIDAEIDDDEASFRVNGLDQDIACVFTNTWAPDATLTIVKQGPADGPVQAFEFEVEELTHDRDYDVTLSTPSDSVEIGIVAGSPVIIDEERESGWQLAAVTCTDRGADLDVELQSTRVQLPVVEPGAQIVCTFVNQVVEPVQIRLTKEIAGVDDGSTFIISSEFDADRQIERMGHGDTAVFDFAFRGEFVNLRLYEDLPVGWGNPLFACDAGLAIVDDFPGSFFLQGGFDPGTIINCTLTNQRLEPATITITKLVEGAVAPAAPFTFLVNGRQVTVAAGDSVDVPAQPGRVSVFERVPVGWRIASIDCPGAALFGGLFASDGVTFDIASGDAVTCTFTNVPEGTATLHLTKVAEGADADEIFVFSTSGGPVELRNGETASVAVPVPSDSFFNFDPFVSFSESFDPDWRVGEVDCPGWQVGQTNNSPFFFDNLEPAGIGIARLTAEPAQSQNFAVRGDIRVGSEIHCTVTNVAAVDKLVPGGDPDAPPFTGQPTEIMISACPGGAATFVIDETNLFAEKLLPEGVSARAGAAALTTGSLAESPAGSGVYMGSFLPTAGFGLVTVTVVCPDGSVEAKELAAIWLDPFGRAVDCAGAPVAGATATLLRSPTGEAGSYTQATGVRVSGLVSIGGANPDGVLGVNPQTTTASGQYGWDVQPSNDFWLVEVTFPGEPTQSFGPIQVPPEVFDADVTFAELGDCSDPDGGSDGGSDGGGSDSASGSTSVTTEFGSQTVPIAAPAPAAATPAASQPRGLAVTGVESNLQAMIGFLITGMGVLSAGAARRRRSGAN